MNNKATFIGGWGAFFGCTLGGAAIGYYQWKGENKKRIEENVGLRRDREETLRRIGERARAERAAQEVAAASRAALAGEAAPAPPGPPPDGATKRGGAAPQPPPASEPPGAATTSRGGGG